MSYLDCRVAMHDAERHARLVEAGNPFALSVVLGSVEAAQRAYMATPEPKIARRLAVAIDRMEAFA
jgi:hypothetical protein